MLKSTGNSAKQKNKWYFKAGILAIDLRQWYGSAALSELNAIHETIQKVGITE